MLLLVGLGNPGRKYAGTRHNVGSMVLDEIIHHHKLSSPRARSRPKGIFSDGVIGSTKILTLKPLTYMNESGKPVGETLRYWKLKPENVFVFHDEIDLPRGKIRAKLGGGDAGHNGLRDITSHIGSDYWRVRIGVDHPGKHENVSKYVLNEFKKSDQIWLSQTFNSIAEALPMLLNGESSSFLTRVNIIEQPPKPKISEIKT
tara:strand:+ start:95 stop:700 length:606 start_codon:yes stop_codon:yes gene_type:complete